MRIARARVLRIPSARSAIRRRGSARTKPLPLSISVAEGAGSSDAAGAAAGAAAGGVAAAADGATVTLLLAIDGGLDANGADRGSEREVSGQGDDEAAGLSRSRRRADRHYRDRCPHTST